MAAEIKVKVFTPGGEEHDIEVPLDMRAEEFISQLAIALNLPINDAGGHPVNWRLDSKDRGVALDGARTMGENGVADGHRLSLLRRTVAG